MSTVRTCAKVILGGEHAVVYGQPAVALPVPSLACQVTVQQADSADVTVRSDQLAAPFVLGHDGDPQLAFMGAGLELAYQELQRTMPGLAPGGLSIEIRSGIPIGSGLGSSAAVLVGLIKAVCGHHGVALGYERLQALAHAAEMGAHGKSSGLDTAVIGHQRPIRFVTGRLPLPLPVRQDVRLVIASTGIPSSTRNVVLDLARRREGDPVRFARIFERIGRTVEEMILALAEGDLHLLGRSMDQNQEWLAELGVSSARLDALVEAGRAAGALGCKLTGAGGGGCMLALVTPANQDVVGEALLSAGAERVVPMDILASASEDYAAV